ncbi:hypothetical protein LshimejAT787_1205250 [Lyophyllum shimeji]|uniref:C2H2-type domain-containing protein n=1 Tax=Lyophyllum shimeji TaxID=47721 RepID=A0A9P3UUE0_LYOSH|nr:hypothetical protein LshimejAT787_1205250 [Lyophyllum shimeji]
MFADQYRSFLTPNQDSFAPQPETPQGFPEEAARAQDAHRALLELPQLLYNQAGPSALVVAPVGNWSPRGPSLDVPRSALPLNAPPQNFPNFPTAFPTSTVAPVALAVSNNFATHNTIIPTSAVSPADLWLHQPHDTFIPKPLLTITPADVLAYHLSRDQNSSIAPAAPANYLPPANYPVAPFPIHAPIPVPFIHPPMPPSPDSAAHAELFTPIPLSIGSPASSETSSGSSAASSSTSSSSSRTRKYTPEFYPANRFTEEAQKSGVYCARIFRCKWGACGAQIELEGHSEAQHTQFCRTIQKHIEEHAEPCEESGRRVCYWDGPGACTTQARFGTPRAMERHIKTHLEDWCVFCQGCDETRSRASQLPPHQRQCRGYQAKQAAGRLTTSTMRRRKGVVKKRKV